MQFDFQDYTDVDYRLTQEEEESCKVLLFKLKDFFSDEANRTPEGIIEFVALNHEYSTEVLSVALGRFDRQNPWLKKIGFAAAPVRTQDEIRSLELETFAACIHAAGLPVVDNLRVADNGFAITHEAKAVLVATYPSVANLPSNEDLNGCGLPRHPFVHPSASMASITPGQPFGNGYTLASEIINLAFGWVTPAMLLRATVDNSLQFQSKAQTILGGAVLFKQPQANVQRILQRCIYDDRYLLSLCEAVCLQLSMMPFDQLKQGWWNVSTDRAGGGND